MLEKASYRWGSILALYFKLVPVPALIKIAYYGICSVLPTVSTLMVARFLDNSIASVNDRKSISAVFVSLAIVIFIRIFNDYGGIAICLINTSASNKIREKSAEAVARKRATIQYRYYESQDTAVLIDRVAGGFEGNIQAVYDLTFHMVVTGAELVGFMAIIGTQLIWAPLVFIITSIPAFIVSYIYGQKQYDVEKDMSKVRKKAYYIANLLTGRDAVEERTVFGYSGKLNDEYRTRFRQFRRAQKRMNSRVWRDTTLSGLLAFMSGAAVIIILLRSVISPDNGLTVGLFVSVVMAVMSLSKKMQEDIPNLIYEFRYKKEYLNELNQVLAFDSENDNISLPAKSPVVLETVEFKDVSFQYPGCEQYVLRDLNLTLSAGHHYALVGTNGSGKTTITKLLTGLYDNYEGEILINGRELRSYSKAELKSVTAIIYQDFCRYPLDIYHNISIGNINAMENRALIEKAVGQIGLTATVDDLPHGYHTPVTKIKEDGVDLSGGQWQRIALARLMVNPAPLKILDEPTASLDPISESRIYDQFGTMMDSQNTNNMILFISHRLGSAKLADSIIVLADGKIAEQGSFDDLMERKGVFFEMFHSQADWYQHNDDAGEER